KRRGGVGSGSFSFRAGLGTGRARRRTGSEAGFLSTFSRGTISAPVPFVAVSMTHTFATPSTFAGAVREPIHRLRESRSVIFAAAPPGSDAAAIALAREVAGEFASVFERHHPAVHSYLARRLGVDLADELAAEAFAVAFAKRDRYDSSYEDARPWL